MNYKIKVAKEVLKIAKLFLRLAFFRESFVEVMDFLKNIMENPTVDNLRNLAIALTGHKPEGIPEGKYLKIPMGRYSLLKKGFDFFRGLDFEPKTQIETILKNTAILFSHLYPSFDEFEKAAKRGKEYPEVDERNTTWKRFLDHVKDNKDVLGAVRAYLSVGAEHFPSAPAKELAPIRGKKRKEYIPQKAEIPEAWENLFKKSSEQEIKRAMSMLRKK